MPIQFGNALTESTNPLGHDIYHQSAKSDVQPIPSRFGYYFSCSSDSLCHRMPPTKRKISGGGGGNKAKNSKTVPESELPHVNQILKWLLVETDHYLLLKFDLCLS